MLTFNCTANVFSLNIGDYITIERQYKALSYKQALAGFTDYLYSNKTIKNANNIQVIKEA